MKLLDRIRQMKNKPFMEAVAAAGAMVASSDGLIHPDETAKLLEFIRLEESLSAFNVGEVLMVFEKYVERFDFDPRLGKEQAFAALRKIERRSEEARLVVLLCIAIAASDEEFTIGQKRMIREICTVLGLRQDEFDLDGPPPKWKVPHRPKTEDPTKKKEPDLSTAPEWMQRTDAIPSPPSLPSEPSPQKAVSSAPEFLPEQYSVKRVPENSEEKRKQGEIENSGAAGNEEPDAVPEWMRNKAGAAAGSSGKTGKPENADAHSDGDNAIPDWMKQS